MKKFIRISKKAAVFSYFFMMIFTAFFLNVENTSAYENDADLIAYWSFDEGSGDTITDNSGNGYNGLKYGGSWVSGISGSAIEFDGTDDYLDFGEALSLWNSLNNIGSFEIWFKPYELEESSLGNDHGKMLVNKDLFNGGTIQIWIFSDQIVAALGDDFSGWKIITKNYDLNENEWYNLALTWDSSWFKLYVNGGYEGYTTGINDLRIVTGSGSELYFGTYTNEKTEKKMFFKGILDEIRFYTKALTGNEILLYYQEFKISNQKPEVNIQTPSSFDTLSGSVLISGDASDQDGTISKVEININSGSWIEVSGTNSWSYIWDTSSVENGNHKIYVRSYDGTDYSSIYSIDVIINNDNTGILYSPINPVAYWSFDTGIGNVAYDESGNNNDGIINGASWIDGKKGKALDFDGADDYVQVSDSDYLDITDDFTIELWIYPHDVGRGESNIWEFNQQWLLCKHRAFSNGDGSWGISNQMEKNDFHWDYQGTDGIDGTTDIQNNVWTHLAYTYDDTQNVFTIYVNGTVDTQVNRDYNIKNTNKDLYIGCEEYNDIWHTYDGLIDEIVIYHRLLDPTEFWGLNYQENESPPNEKPTVNINSFSDILSDTVIITGTADEADGTIEKVEIRIDTGSWIIVTGTDSWSYSWDTTKSIDGTHTIYARSYDGEDYSGEEYIYVTISNPTQQSDTELIAYWNFNEGSGTIAYDSSGYENDISTDGPRWIDGIKGKALYFDGVDDYGLVKNDVVLNPDFITIEAWIKIMGNDGKYREIVRKHSGGGFSTGGYDLRVTDKNYLQLEVFYGSVTGNTLLSSNTWYHVAGTFDGSYSKVYINGVLDNSAYVPSAYLGSTNLDLGVGKIPDWGGEYFNGIIDEVGIYSRVLTPDEIQQHYDEYANIEEEQPKDEVETPGFSTTVGIAAIGIGALVAFFRRYRRN